MSEQFKAGQICIGQNHVVDIEYNGMECEVTIGYGLKLWRNRATGEIGQDMGYEVVWANGERCICDHYNLRKKQPPRSAKSIMREAILKAKQPQKVPA